MPDLSVLTPGEDGYSWALIAITAELRSKGEDYMALESFGTHLTHCCPVVDPVFWVRSASGLVLGRNRPHFSVTAFA